VIAFSEKKRKSVRQLATEILLKVDTRKSYADVLLDHSASKMLHFPSATALFLQSLLTELSAGVARSMRG